MRNYIKLGFAIFTFFGTNGSPKVIAHKVIILLVVAMPVGRAVRQFLVVVVQVVGNHTMAAVGAGWIHMAH